MSALDLIWLVPALPFAGAAVNGLLLRNRQKSLVIAVGVGFPGVSLLIALAAIAQYLGSVRPAPFEQVLYAWTTGALSLDVGFRVDPLSAVMLFVVTFVGFWIHLYSVGYMGREEGYRRYFAYLNLFMGAMLLLILGNNYLVLFVGWEGVGLCSYLLIGYYFEETFPPYAGKKAFIVNRIGDFGFLIGLFAIWSDLGHAPFRALNERILAATLRWRTVRSRWGSRRRRSSRSFSSSARPARARRFRSSSGSPTRWPVRHPSPP
jgi:NADH-quinone oxidoreductase subunit L